MTERVLSERELNRALLERSGLLERRRGSLPAAVERMGGVQAQYAPSIYVGLWSRVEGLRRDQVTRALERRTLVQATLLRNTIHVVSPADYWQFAAATRDSRRSAWLQARARARTGSQGGGGRGRAHAAAAAGRPRRRKELMPLVDGDPVLFNGATLWLDVVRVPPAGTWEHRRADIYERAETWLGREQPEHPRRHTVARYLGAFGPAAVADIVSWSGIPPAELKPVLEDMELRRFRDEGGTLLLDLPRQAAAGPLHRGAGALYRSGTPPCWCTRAAPGILPERFRPQVFSTKTPQSVPTFTVDGQVAGTWREEKGRVRVKPFEPLPKAARREVDEEASRLAEFIS